MKPPVLVDTGPLVALLNKCDSAHDECKKVFATLDPPLLTTWPVLTEAAWLLRSNPELVQSLIRSVEVGFIRLAWLSDDDAADLVAILKRYNDQGFQLADVTLMHLANRDELSTIFTLDKRDFSVFRTDAGKAVQMLP